MRAAEKSSLRYEAPRRLKLSVYTGANGSER